MTGAFALLGSCAARSTAAVERLTVDDKNPHMLCGSDFVGRRDNSRLSG